MFVEPSDESDDDLSVDLRDGLSADSSDDLSMDSSDETTVEKSRRLVGGLIFEYGFANAMTDGVITDYSLGFVAY
jgi:hypothetical protein